MKIKNIGWAIILGLLLGGCGTNKVLTKPKVSPTNIPVNAPTIAANANYSWPVELASIPDLSSVMKLSSVIKTNDKNGIKWSVMVRTTDRKMVDKYIKILKDNKFVYVTDFTEKSIVLETYKRDNAEIMLQYKLLGDKTDLVMTVAFK